MKYTSVPCLLIKDRGRGLCWERKCKYKQRSIIYFSQTTTSTTIQLLEIYKASLIQQTHRLVSAVIDLFRLGGLLPHFRPCDDTLKNSCFQIFKQSGAFEEIILRCIKEQFSREYHAACNGKTNRPSAKGLLHSFTDLV